ncbi:MAG: DUF4465 domain-containing protein, partial [Gemmataceae bacterium]
FSVNTRPDSMRITNTTYAGLSMRDGDSFSKKFGGISGNDPDFFLLTIVGKSVGGQTLGTIDFYLADYRFSNNSQDYIIQEWTTVNLSTLPEQTRRLEFILSSTDNGTFGMNTPAYFAMDNLAIVAVPEPSLGLLGTVIVAGVLARRRRSEDEAFPHA